jgi:hypothetical protein
MVTYTGGRKRDGGTPTLGVRMRCIASGVLRKRRSALAAGDRRSDLSEVTCQVLSTGVAGVSTIVSSPRRSCEETR